MGPLYSTLTFVELFLLYFVSSDGAPWPSPLSAHQPPFGVADKVSPALKRLRMKGRMPYCQTPPTHPSVEGVLKLNLHGKSTPFSNISKE